MKRLKKVGAFYERTAWGRWLDEVEAARWQFFGYTRIGHAITNVADAIHEKYPQSRAAQKFWQFCLPF